MPILRLLSLFIVLLICLAGAPATFFAQQSTPAPTRLALEVTFYPGRKPAFETVPGPDAKPNGAWFGMFSRIASWRAPAGAPRIEAVRVVSKVEGDAVRVIVSTLSGRALENEQQVATYLIRENEKITADELRDFGIEPFAIKLVRVTPNIALVPPVILKGVNSLLVVNAVGNDSTLPSYRLTLLNQSSKNVVSVTIDVVAGEKPLITATRRGIDGGHLIAAGTSQDLTVLAPSRAQGVPDAYSPASPPNQQIQIKAVVFDDGTYEGDAEAAAAVKGFRAGEKMELPRLIRLLEEALNASDGDVNQRLSNLESQVSSLSSDAEPGTIQSLAAEFPQLGAKAVPMIKGTMEIAATTIKSDLLKEIHRMRAAEPRQLDANAYQSWLTGKKERYVKWLSRL
jgi:hypothetical protein